MQKSKWRLILKIYKSLPPELHNEPEFKEWQRLNQKWSFHQPQNLLELPLEKWAPLIEALSQKAVALLLKKLPSVK